MNTVLPWHREAAESINGLLQTWGEGALSKDKYAAIIAAYDPHAETLRLLEQAAVRLDIWNEVGSLHEAIRAHLATMKGTK